VKIVAMGSAHIPQVAALHCTSLTGLLGALGVSAARAFYARAVTSTLTTAFVALDGERVVGFVLGSRTPAGLQHHVRSTGRSSLLASIAAGAIRNPIALKWLLRRGRPDYDTTAPELTYVAVATDRRATGIGRQLIDAFSDAMAREGITQYELSVDEGNASARAFYERLGFREIGSYREFDTTHARYRLTLPGRKLESDPN
jgi:ribosomal protein S18 acetylase RimI-like enzyme